MESCALATRSRIGFVRKARRSVHRPQSKDALQGFVLQHFGLWLPRRVWTPGHSTPFAFVADAFFHPERDIAAWASRSGMKTLGASVIAALEFLYLDNLQARVLAGSEDQARFLYQYWQEWCNGVLTDRVVGDIKRLNTSVGGGKFEILAASEKKVRGGKVQRLFEDELDTIAPEIDQAAVGMIDSRPGLPGRTIYTSTWHRPMGLMGKLIDGCPDNGVSLHKWNIWESVAKCPKERHQNGRGCRDCPLTPCMDKAREVWGPRARTGAASLGEGVYGIDVLIKAYKKLSVRTWEAETGWSIPSSTRCATASPPRTYRNGSNSTVPSTGA